MNKQEAKNRIKELTEIINYHAKKYYDEDTSEISDFEYDMLVNELKNLKSKFSDIEIEGSRYDKIGGKIKEGFEKVTHEIPLQSLQDVFNFEEVEDFNNRMKKLEEETKIPLQYTVEAKIDGLSVSLEYKNGEFVRGATRGDGQVGEDVTENLKTVKTIPQKLKENIDIIVRGEIFISKSDFEKLNEEREILDEPLFANARNAAAGSLRQLDCNITKNRPLDIYVFNVQKLENSEINSHYESILYLKKLGFQTVPIAKLCNQIDEAIAYIKEIGEQRGELPFGTDGAVIKVDNFDLRKKAGVTFKTPKWAIAYKYPPEQKETFLQDIICQVGRTGAITPMAILEPIKLAGSTISKATLHNEDFIKEKDLRIGDTVVIQKAGDVIPEVVKAITEKRNGTEKEFIMPKTCPVCGAEAIREPGESVTRCIGIECSAKLLRNIVHFVSKDCMNIDGLGYSIVQQLIDNKLIYNIADIYSLTTEQIASLKKNGQKFAQNLYQSINDSKNNNLDKLINALGIRHIGAKTAKILAKKYRSIENLMQICETENNVNAKEELSLTEEIGEITADSIVEFFRQEQTVDLINKLKTAQVNMEYFEAAGKDERFNGMTFVLTGSLEKYTRDEASEIIEQFGGKTSGTISKKTSYVLVGEEAGSKLKKAQTLGIKTISEAEFDEMIK